MVWNLDRHIYNPFGPELSDADPTLNAANVLRQMLRASCSLYTKPLLAHNYRHWNANRRLRNELQKPSEWVYNPSRLITSREDRTNRSRPRLDSTKRVEIRAIWAGDGNHLE